MDNRIFFLVVAGLLFGGVGWMAYDSRQVSEAIGNDKVGRDVLIGTDGSMAPVQYLYRFPEPLYSHALSTAQIESLSRGSELSESYRVYGLTQAGFNIGTSYHVEGSKKWFKKQYAIWVEDLKVEFGYNTLNVYVTNAYPVDSCEYRETLDHENQHVEAHRRVYLDYQRVLERALADAKDIPLSSRPLIVGSWEEGKDRVGKLISAATDPLFEEFQRNLEVEHARIDTPENYAGLRRRCSNW